MTGIPGAGVGKGKMKEEGKKVDVNDLKAPSV
jgi:hypothetical protein